MITKDNAKQWLPLVQAMAEGKTIQVRGDLGGWFDVVSGCLTDLRDGVARYRIKPEPKLRPWKAEEAPRQFMVRKKHSPKGHACVAYSCICLGPEFPNNGQDFHIYPTELEGASDHWQSFQQMMEDWVRITEDGTEHPCGVLCEGEEHGEA